MKLLLVSLCLVSGTAFASGLAPVTYHDGTLVSSPAAASNNDDAFVVRSEGILYALTPLSTGERATLGWGKEFSKYSSLDHQLPGTSLKVRDDGRHFFVRVGNRESMYSAIETR